MSTTVHAYAAREAGGAFEAFEYDLPELGPGDVDVRVLHCGLCHSDLSMRNNDWSLTSYPFVGGHEVVGVVEATGPSVPNVAVGDTVGVGWYTGSCMHCIQCLSGRHNRCGDAEQTIVGRHGGFADRVRSHWAWVAKLPEALAPAIAGPLFCGGITVFGPLKVNGVKPTDRVGVIGIGGLGHLALKFLDKWGCEVTAFSTSSSKRDEALAMGADRFVNAKEPGALDRLAGRFDMLLNTTSARLDWDGYVDTLRPGGVLHSVGAVNDSFGLKTVFPLLEYERKLASSSLAGPAAVMEMLEFCARHGIEPTVERMPMDRINDAFEKLEANEARYRVVLDAA